jgi:dUTP pyrophosphatase
MARVDKFGKIIWENSGNVGNRYPILPEPSEEECLGVCMYDTEITDDDPCSDLGFSYNDYEEKRLPTHNDIPVKIVLVDGAKVPKYAHDGDSGFDLTNNEDEFYLHPGERRLVKTGIKVSFPEDCTLEIRSRSGICLKHGIVVLNSPGTIDSGYINEIGVILYNSGKSIFRVEKGDRIAQAVLIPIYKAVFKVVNSLEDTERGLGGFGSSGK